MPAGLFGPIGRPGLVTVEEPRDGPTLPTEDDPDEDDVTPGTPTALFFAVAGEMRTVKDYQRCQTIRAGGRHTRSGKTVQPVHLHQRPLLVCLIREADEAIPLRDTRDGVQHDLGTLAAVERVHMLRPAVLT
jgi:hypothetical protein